MNASVRPNLVVAVDLATLNSVVKVEVYEGREGVHFTSLNLIYYLPDAPSWCARLLTRPQIADFCQQHRELLKKGGETFFPFWEEGKGAPSVARVKEEGAQISITYTHLGQGEGQGTKGKWRAADDSRFVVMQ